jgi:hypothetical protein
MAIDSEPVPSSVLKTRNALFAMLAEDRARDGERSPSAPESDDAVVSTIESL